MTLETLLEPKTRASQDARVEIATVVDDDAHPGLRLQGEPDVLEDCGDALAVLVDRSARGAAGRPAQLGVAALVEAQQLYA